MNLEFKEYLSQSAMKKSKEAKLIIISGMSGAGKNVVADILEEKYHCAFINKYVTRPFRKIEIASLEKGENIGIKSVSGKYNDGEKPKEEQIRLEAKRRQAFIDLRLPLTYINYGNYYGFSMEDINNYLEHGRNTVVIVNDPGVIRDLKNIYRGQCISCYVHRTIPKNKEIFMEIAKQRGDTQESAEIRYRKALKDWDIYTNNTELYDYTILNTDNGVQRLANMLEDLNNKDFRNKQNEMEEKQEKPKVYIFSGNPGSGKDEALETIRIQGILHSIILPKHTTRHRQESDGEEMICFEDEGFDMQSCDLQYNNFGETYGINTNEIKERLKDGISSSIVVSNKKALEQLKRKFPEEIVNIYIQGLSKEEYMIQQKTHLEEDYVKKRIEEYEKADELYYNQWLDFNHVIINNGDLSDLKRQIDSIQRYYEGGRDLSGEKVRDYMKKANIYIERFSRNKDYRGGKNYE